jgi:DNA mismatch endonuclease, patch repair protein
MDNLSTAARSTQMALVRSTNSKAEIALRSWTHRLGYRFRLHARDVPGSPDICIKSRRKAIFLHGCFWHRHDCPSGRRLPKSRTEFWTAKLEQNRKRDVETLKTLKERGWTALVVWECEMRDRALVESRLKDFLDA